MIRFIQTSLEKYFYLAMSLLIIAVAAYGFGRFFDITRFNPATSPPFMVHVHAVTMITWLSLFLTQSVLIRSSNVRMHRRLGIFGAVLGALLPIIGVTTAIIAGIWHRELGRPFPEFLSIQFMDMLIFSIAFGLAIHWRKRPEFHRRLVFIATAVLTASAFARFPPEIVPRNWAYVFVDLVILLGVARDLIVDRRVHAVYLVGLPFILLAHALALYLLLSTPPALMSILKSIINMNR